MRMTTHAPDRPWSGDVQAIFHYADFVPDHAVERVVPTGHVFVLFALDGQP